MARLETNLAEKFYSIINSVPSKHWREFIRILGLPENDIDEISYDDDDIVEQKYQMLTRWKNYYGYRESEENIMQCLHIAKAEISDQMGPDELNRNLLGRLRENRLIAKRFYSVMREVESGRKKEFAMSKLKLPDHVVNSIKADYGKDVDEQCYQMLLAWKRRSNLQSYHEINEALGKFMDEFFQPQNPADPDARNEARGRNQPTADVGDGPGRWQAPSGDVR